LKRNHRLILAFLVSSVLALIIGLLSNLAADTLVINKPWIIWVALIVAFIISLPITLYLFLKEANQLGDSEVDKDALLPSKQYLRFFGRDTLLDEIMSTLREPNRKKIIGIDGMGGIGKTALAREVAERCINERLFDTVIWEPQHAKLSLGTGVGLDWVALTVAIGRQLGSPAIQGVAPERRQERLASLLRSQRVLLVIDNMESMGDNQNEIARQLHPILSSNKSIMTSRHRFTDHVYSIHLRGLESESATQMLRFEATERGVKRIINAQSRDLHKINEAAGGSPLALKLIVGQLQHLSLDNVIESLQSLGIDQTASDENEYVNFYKSIFWKSWQLLSEPAQRLLISMSVFAPNVGGTLEAIQSISELGKRDVLKRIEDLWSLSFVDVTETGVRKTRYYLHPLTQHFVVSDIVQMS